MPNQALRQPRLRQPFSRRLSFSIVIGEVSELHRSAKMHFLLITGVSKRDLERQILLSRREGMRQAFQFVARPPRQVYNSPVVKLAIRALEGYLKIVSSVENGWPFLEVLIERAGWTAASVRFDPDNVAEIIMWTGRSKPRVVRALREDRWTWFTDGTPLKFEDGSQYLARRIQDRLSPEIIERYLTAMGYPEKIKRSAEQGGRANAGYRAPNNGRL